MIHQLAKSIILRAGTKAAIRVPLKFAAPVVRTFSSCGAPECGPGVCGSKSTSSVSSASIGVAAAKSASSKGLSTLASVRTNPAANANLSPTSPQAKANLDFMANLLEQRRPGYSLPQPFYLDPITYAYDIKYMWSQSWLFAGYTCQLKKPGDYFTYEIGSDSIIVIRSGEATADDSGIRAFHNSCRHRGSRIVTATQETKQTKRLVCPYHQWGYDRSGALVNARDMDESFDKSANGLHQIHCEEVEGLIFLCLTPKHEQPRWSFEPARKLMAKQLAPHMLGMKAKIAYSANYTINANWKLVYENNRECLHCAGSHPEYVKSNYDLHLTYKKDEATGKFVRDLDPNYPAKDKILEYINERSKEWESLGFACSPDSSFPGDGWYRASRMVRYAPHVTQPLKAGWVTESIDGQPVSTVMGRLPQRDMGSFRIHTLPNYWIHLSGDHGVSSRLTPTGPHTTEARVDWLVDADAVEGKDYHLDKMLPFWSKTSDQDWHLCEINMQGVSSSAYRPGRLSQRKEAGLDRFIGWYVDTMKAGIEKDRQKV